jgi:hypothetical protein
MLDSMKSPEDRRNLSQPVGAFNSIIKTLGNIRTFGNSTAYDVRKSSRQQTVYVLGWETPEIRKP